MLEIIGSSNSNYSKAVEDAVNQIVRSGEKVHFFEVIKQHGALIPNERHLSRRNHGYPSTSSGWFEGW
ncbi:MAG: dodecin domain-containing protein [Candidatus Omnitrophota bacterium]